MYNAVNGFSPAYIQELLCPYQPTRILRSCDKGLFCKPNVHSSYGERSFSFAAPLLWNNLPVFIKESANANI